MLAKLSITISLLISLSTQLFSQSSIVGNWQRIMPRNKHDNIISKQNSYKYLEIRLDSTFYIHIDPTARVERDSTDIESPIPGWHIADEYNGTWEVTKDNDLFLAINPKAERVTLAYKIIKLTKKKLILRSRLAKNHKGKIAYRRL